MRFYTNVVQWGNYILVREYKNGERLNHKVRYSPTLFVPVQKETGWKTLDGKKSGQKIVVFAVKKWSKNP